MPRCAHRRGDFFKAHFLVKVICRFHPSDGFEVAATKAFFFCCLQAKPHHFFAQAEPSYLRVEVHFFQFARLPVAASQRCDSAAADQLALVRDDEKNRPFLAVRLEHSVHFGVIDGVAFADAAELGHHGADEVGGFFIVGVFDGAKNKIFGLIHGGNYFWQMLMRPFKSQHDCKIEFSFLTCNFQQVFGFFGER